ncbi:MAG: Zn-ribbon domain-containing OB-fold protein [Acidimicrobiales bacterium]
MTSRPLPRPTELSQPFWDGCAEGVLRVQQCGQCGELVFVPRPMCPACQSDDLAWIDSTGLGEVYSYTVVHRPPSPAFEVPYVVAIVELEEGWYLLSNVIDCDPGDVTVGAPVTAVFDPVDPAITLPQFRLR